MTDNIPVTGGSGYTVATDDVGGVQYQVIKPSFGVDGAATLVSSSNPLPVTVGSSGTSIGVYFDRANPTVTLAGFPSSLGVYFDRSNPAVNITSGTVTNITNTVGVYFDRSNPSVNVGTPTVAAITASVGVYFDRGNPTVTANAGTDLNTSSLLTTAAHDAAFGTAGSADAQVRTIQGIASMTPVQVSQATASNLNMTEASAASALTALQIMDDWDETDRAKVNVIVGQAGVAAGSGVTGATTQRVVHATDVAGSVNIVAQGLAALNIGSTASIFSVSGSSAAAQTAGITVIAPSASYNFKIFAYSIQTTGVLASALTFANGNSAGQTEFWRPLIATGGSGSQSTTPVGANLAVSPPGYLFATGTSTTLVIAGNNGSTIHYSVSYIKESA